MIRTIIDYHYKNREAKLAGTPFVQSYSYKLGSLHDGEYPDLIGVESISYKAADRKWQSMKKDFAYRCFEEQTCFVGIMFLAPQKDFQLNTKFFERILASLKRRSDLSIRPVRLDKGK